MEGIMVGVAGCGWVYLSKLFCLDYNNICHIHCRSSKERGSTETRTALSFASRHSLLSSLLIIIIIITHFYQYLRACACTASMAGEGDSSGSAGIPEAVFVVCGLLSQHLALALVLVPLLVPCVITL